MDGDGDVDALSAVANNGKLVWHANVHGNGSAWTTHEIVTGMSGLRSVFAIDMDRDGDMDALSASGGVNTIAWHENLHGNGSAWATHVVSTNALNARFVFAIDMDGDGDVDVLSASEDDDKIAWYENLDSVGTNFTEHVVSTAADFAKGVYAVDMDFDGDIDVLSASFNDDTIAWYENEGDGMFVGHSHTGPTLLRYFAHTHTPRTLLLNFEI